MKLFLLAALSTTSLAAKGYSHHPKSAPRYSASTAPQRQTKSFPSQIMNPTALQALSSMESARNDIIESIAKWSNSDRASVLKLQSMTNSQLAAKYGELAPAHVGTAVSKSTAPAASARPTPPFLIFVDLPGTICSDEASCGAKQMIEDWTGGGTVAFAQSTSDFGMRNTVARKSTKAVWADGGFRFFADMKRSKDAATAKRKVQFVTILREPVARALALWGASKAHAPKSTLDFFLAKQQKRGRSPQSVFDNPLVHLFCCDGEQLTDLAHDRCWARAADAKMLKCAKNFLPRFDAIGFASDHLASLDAIHRVIPTLEHPTECYSPTTDGAPIASSIMSELIDGAAEKALAVATKYDNELYAAAMQAKGHLVAAASESLSRTRMARAAGTAAGGLRARAVAAHSAALTAVCSRGRSANSEAMRNSAIHHISALPGAPPVVRLQQYSDVQLLDTAHQSHEVLERLAVASSPSLRGSKLMSIGTSVKPESLGEKARNAIIAQLAGAPNHMTGQVTATSALQTMSNAELMSRHDEIVRRSAQATAMNSAPFVRDTVIAQLGGGKMLQSLVSRSRILWGR